MERGSYNHICKSGICHLLVQCFMAAEPLPQELQDEYDTLDKQDYRSNCRDNRNRIARTRTFQCLVPWDANSLRYGNF